MEFYIVSRGSVVSKGNKTHGQGIHGQKMSYLLCQRSSPASEDVSLAAPKLLKAAIKWE